MDGGTLRWRPPFSTIVGLVVRLSMVGDDGATLTQKQYSMDIQTFVEQSIGQWRSQRSAHHLAFRHFEAIESVIDIVAL